MENNAPLQNTFENNFIRFIQILRHLGLRISSAEAVDAINALIELDILDRNQVKIALMATLTKSLEDRVILNQAFRSFFITSEERSDRTARNDDMREKEVREIGSAEEELIYQVEDPDGNAAREVKLPLTEEEKRVYTKLPEDKRNKLRDYLQKQFHSNPVNNPEQLIANMVRSSLNYWRHYLKLQDGGPPEVEYTGEEEIDEVLREVVENIRDEEHLIYQDIQKITDTDMPAALALINKLSRRLSIRIARRYHRTNKQQGIDLRRTIRYNIRYGGAMFRLKYRTRKVQKPKLLLICDVSGSMAKYAVFVLQFMYGLSAVVKEIDSFIFSEDVENITGKFDKKRPFAEIMTEIINRSESWGKGTDFGKALAEIDEKHGNILNKQTLIIVVSDTKVLNAEKAAYRLSVVKKKVKDIIWLNTLPRRMWPDTPSVGVFRGYCRMFECNTLAHLDRIIRTQMLY
ncbi:vWA domain-containing protein [Phosphitispora sp. TUW77]|uniref:vWA domain-containing protein n=1 Tax=Phosphitispora sp. TUW77 TaxID=3152361 RepID=UPI003AB3E726